MYNNYYQKYSGYNQQYIRPRIFSGAVKNIIIANLAVFLFMTLFQSERFFLYYFGLMPQLVWGRGFVWQLFTYLFIHGSFGHIFMNMFVLWMFGSEIENAWGKKEFYRFYFITGVGSGLITLLLSLNSTIPVVGASGAVYAILVAFAMMYPNRLIYFYFLIPIKAKYFVLIMGVITFFSSFSQGSGGISHLTHLGGIIIGYLYLNKRNLASKIRFRMPHISIKNPFNNFIRKVDKKSEHPDTNIHGTDQTMREELDRLLDKINKTGYESLGESERQNLTLIGKYFADKDKMRN
ncbi:MAG: rhomboid family intramembrane serine protease [Candidatus Marinimicrobia bacterium]|nr:rhomboid family intramembrane serine protease [Candidatus Neomarinimicrobiota bacterium]